MRALLKLKQKLPKLPDVKKPETKKSAKGIDMQLRLRKSPPLSAGKNKEQGKLIRAMAQLYAELRDVAYPIGA